MKYIIIIAVIILAVYFWRKNSGGKKTDPQAGPSAKGGSSVHFSSPGSGLSYYSYTGRFYTIVETIAQRKRFHEMEALIMIRKTSGQNCTVEMSLFVDGSIPSDVTFSPEYRIANETISFKTDAVDFSQPSLVMDMILSDMNPSLPMLSITPTETYILSKGDFENTPFVVCRFKVQYNA